MPLTGTGKIDRMRLPAPSASDRELADPLTPTEEKLIEIWEAILNVKNIGTFDDFLDVGGTSMLAIQCVARINKLFAVEIAVDAFFEEATIHQIAQTICRMRGEAASR
jgi:acyl carrier protein